MESEQTTKIDYMVILQNAIIEGKKQMILPEYQKDTSDNEILGILVSKFSEWDFGNISEITKHACEDSNGSLEDLS